LDNHEEEFASYQNALALNPNLWEAYTSWAVTERHLGNYAHAKELYLAALKVYPELTVRYPRQIYGLALICWKLREYKLSCQYVNQVLSVRPDDESSLDLKRQLLSSLWRKDNQYVPDALLFFRMWLIDDPADMYVRRELYLLYRAQADKQQASALLSGATSIVYTSPQSLYYYACMLIDEGKIPEAIDALEKAFQQNQGHNIVHKLADLKKKVGNYQEAIRLYKLILADNELHVLPSIADCYNFLKEHEVCVWCCARVIKLDPANGAWWNNLVYSLMALDKGLCAITVEKLRIDLMQALSSNEEPDPSPSEFALLLLQAIGTEFGKSFVDSILTPSPPF
jgi:tetratricopeptide (TPR) repeat protein